MTCPACFIVDGCGGIGHGAIDNHCCRCIPNRACVSLLTEFDVCSDSASASSSISSSVSDDLFLVDSTEAQWISAIDGTCGRKFSGSLSCESGLTVDFIIEFKKDIEAGLCSICLESTSLGYTNDEIGGDLRVCLNLGGVDRLASVKRDECRAMSFDFPVEAGGSPGTITVRPAQYVEAVKRRPGIRCMFERVCITVFDGETETKHHICATDQSDSLSSSASSSLSSSDDSNNQWSLFVDDDPLRWVTIYVDSHNPAGVGETSLTLTSWLNPEGDPITVWAECPDMLAEWDLPNGAWIRIRGDKLNKCTDCKCYCECICVLYVEDELTQERGKACRQLSEDGCLEYWTITLLGKVFNFYLSCLGCENPTTFIVIDPPEDLSLISTQSQGVICPDRISAEWTMSRDGGTGTGHISLACAACGEECTLEEISVSVPCCPDVTIPVVLYATVTGSSGCPQFPEGYVIGLGKTGPDEGICWTGSATVELSGQPCIQHFSLSCFGSGESARWYMTPNICSSLNESSNEVTLISCDPLILEVTLVVGCCDDSPNGTVTLQVTA